MSSRGPAHLLAAAAGALALMLSGCGGGGGGATTFRVISPSMDPTYKIGDVLAVDTGAYKHAQPRRGDVVVVHAPTGAEENRCARPSEPADGHPCEEAYGTESDIQVIKRVAGLPGDRVKIAGNHAYVDGQRQAEPFIRATPCNPAVGCELPREITVPSGTIFVLGDNRPLSDDSRFFGPLPIAWVVGRVKGVAGQTPTGG